MLSPSKHERLSHPPFDRLRVDGVLFFPKEEKIPISNVYTVMD